MSPARTVPDSPTIGRLRDVIRRYERDVGLLTGKIIPVHRDIDDVALMNFYADSQDRQALVGDRRLRIKTLEATIALLQEVAESEA